MRKHRSGIAVALCACLLTTLALADQLPSDVRSNHWAAGAVQEILQSGVMTSQDDHQFHGEAHVTHGQAVIALAKLAEKLEKGGWHALPSKPVPDKVSKTLGEGDWETQSVTRYEMASVLSRFGDYIANGMPHPQPGAKDLAKSEALPTGVKIPVPTSHPAYKALKYLTDHKMITAASPLLKADSQPVKGAELSRGLAEMADGLNNLFTELGKDENGNTPDNSFQPKKSSPPLPGKK